MGSIKDSSGQAGNVAGLVSEAKWIDLKPARSSSQTPAGGLGGDWAVVCLGILGAGLVRGFQKGAEADTQPRGRAAMEQIAEWLANLGMSEYAERFAENRIDFAVLPDLTDQDLKDIGVVLGDRRKIMRAIARIDAEPETMGLHS